MHLYILLIAISIISTQEQHTSHHSDLHSKLILHSSPPNILYHTARSTWFSTYNSCYLVSRRTTSIEIVLYFLVAGE
ncbi:MAG: hypothetical protein BYD32DRAFT_430777 [Podila humilis]|nr:MAG: hypothetical protein BYD32DRAFT_430777 [Podila humilis]